MRKGQCSVKQTEHIYRYRQLDLLAIEAEEPHQILMECTHRW